MRINDSIEIVAAYKERVNFFTFMRDSSGERLLEVTSKGNCTIYGSLVEQADSMQLTDGSTTSDFVVMDSQSNTLARINAATGVLYLAGNIVTQQSSLDLNAFLGNESQEFIVQDSDEDVVAVIDDNGDLRLAGDYVEYEWY